MPRAMKVVGGTDLPAPTAKKKQVRPKTVTQAAKDGDQKELLVAMRDRVAKTVEDPDTPARDLAALTRRLMEISKEIRGLEMQEAEDGSVVEPGEDEPFDPETV